MRREEHDDDDDDGDDNQLKHRAYETKKWTTQKLERNKKQKGIKKIKEERKKSWKCCRENDWASKIDKFDKLNTDFMQHHTLYFVFVFQDRAKQSPIAIAAVSTAAAARFP